MFNETWSHVLRRDECLKHHDNNRNILHTKSSNMHIWKFIFECSFLMFVHELRYNMYDWCFSSFSFCVSSYYGPSFEHNDQSFEIPITIIIKAKPFQKFPQNWERMSYFHCNSCASLFISCLNFCASLTHVLLVVVARGLDIWKVWPLGKENASFQT